MVVKGTLDLASLAARRGLVTANHLRSRPVEEKAAICRGLVQNVWPLIADNTIKLPPLTIFPLAEAAAAHARLESGQNIGKIVPLGCALAAVSLGFSELPWISRRITPQPSPGGRC